MKSKSCRLVVASNLAPEIAAATQRGDWDDGAVRAPAEERVRNAGLATSISGCFSPGKGIRLN